MPCADPHFCKPSCSYTKAAAPESSPYLGAERRLGGLLGGGNRDRPDTVGYATARRARHDRGLRAIEQPVSDVTPHDLHRGKGDSLWSIAKKNGLSKADLATANHLKATTVLHVGQKIIIPAKSGLPAAAETSAAEAAPAGQAKARRCPRAKRVL